jgi:hypothetical protein
MSEKCPKCGALRVPQTHVDYFFYKCNSVCKRNTQDTSFRQSDNCRIAELEAEVERLTKNVGDVYQLLEKSRKIRREQEVEVERLREDQQWMYEVIGVDNARRLKAEVNKLRAEWQATCDLLGEGYAGEWDLPDEKRRPLDSLVSEVLAQRDEEVERLQKGLDSAVKTARQRDKAIARVWNALGCTIDLNITVWEQVAELQAIANALPKCWGLKDGKLVRDVPVVSGKTMWRIKSDGQAIPIKVSSVSAQYVFSGSIPFSPEQLSDTREAAEHAAEAAGGES